MLATVTGPRALVIQPIYFRTLLLYYMVIAIATTDIGGRIEKYASMNQPTLPRSGLQTDFICLCIPLIYSARKRTYIRHNRNRLSVAGRYYVTARFRIQSRTESLGPKLHDSRCSRRERERERERENAWERQREKKIFSAKLFCPRNPSLKRKMKYRDGLERSRGEVTAPERRFYAK